MLQAAEGGLELGGLDEQVDCYPVSATMDCLSAIFGLVAVQGLVVLSYPVSAAMDCLSAIFGLVDVQGLVFFIYPVSAAMDCLSAIFGLVAVQGLVVLIYPVSTAMGYIHENWPPRLQIHVCPVCSVCSVCSAWMRYYCNDLPVHKAMLCFNLNAEDVGAAAFSETSVNRHDRALGV